MGPGITLTTNQFYAAIMQDLNKEMPLGPNLDFVLGIFCPIRQTLISPLF